MLYLNLLKVGATYKLLLRRFFIITSLENMLRICVDRCGKNFKFLGVLLNNRWYSISSMRLFWTCHLKNHSLSTSIYICRMLFLIGHFFTAAVRVFHLIRTVNLRWKRLNTLKSSVVKQIRSFRGWHLNFYFLFTIFWHRWFRKCHLFDLKDVFLWQSGRSFSEDLRNPLIFLFLFSKT